MSSAGPALDKLNTIAAAGGTGSASMVSVDNPTQTASTFQEALDKIRGEVLSCDFAMPKPPEGKALDIEAVNVAISANGSEEILTYSGDCKDGKGWKYDNLAAPTKVTLCPSSCDTATGSAHGKLTVAFGCKTKGEVK